MDLLKHIFFRAWEKNHYYIIFQCRKQTNYIFIACVKSSKLREKKTNVEHKKQQNSYCFILTSYSAEYWKHLSIEVIHFLSFEPENLRNPRTLYKTIENKRQRHILVLAIHSLEVCQMNRETTTTTPTWQSTAILLNPVIAVCLCPELSTKKEKFILFT